MWRRKTGFEDFLEIVRAMPFLTRGRTYRSYYNWNHERQTYEYNYRNIVREDVNVDTLNEYVEGMKHLTEQQKIAALNAWVRQRNGSAVNEFRNIRRQVEYDKRLREYEAS
tara:strand:+ start:11514 stop:11846 length:333 start_codon:yes stop_codon:yes gene_type:complete